MGLEWGAGVNAYLCPSVSVFNDTIRGKVVTTVQYTRAVSTLKQGSRGAGEQEQEGQRRHDSANVYSTAYSGNITHTRSHTTGRKKKRQKIRTAPTKTGTPPLTDGAFADEPGARAALYNPKTTYI